MTRSEARPLSPKPRENRWSAVTPPPPESAGETSWHDFACEIFRLEGLTPALTPVSSDEYGARAKRPRYSVLAHDSLAALGIAEPRAWDAALAAYLAERRAQRSGSPRLLTPNFRITADVSHGACR